MGINSKINTPTTIQDLNGYFNKPNGTYVNYSQINTNATAFETINGESILTFYNPNCSYTYGMNGKNNQQNLMQPTMCANFIYDLNGKKGPNKVGKDIGFMTAFYPTDTEIAAPMPAGHMQIAREDAAFTIGQGNAKCRQTFGEKSRMANIEELKSIFTNNNLGYINSYSKKFISGDTYASTTLDTSSMSYNLGGEAGAIWLRPLDHTGYTNIFCVK